MRINLILKDPRLAKDPAVKKWLRTVEKRIEKHLTDQRYEEKALEAHSLGVPIIMDMSGAIRVVDEFYSMAPRYRTKKKLKELIDAGTTTPPIIKHSYLRTGMPKFQRDYKLPRDPNDDKVDLKKYKALGKRLKHFKPRKRSKLSYRGDHYE